MEERNNNIGDTIKIIITLPILTFLKIQNQ